MKYEYAMQYMELMNKCKLSENELKELLRKYPKDTIFGAFCNNTLVWKKLRNERIKRQALEKMTYTMSDNERDNKSCIDLIVSKLYAVSERTFS